MQCKIYADNATSKPKLKSKLTSFLLKTHAVNLKYKILSANNIYDAKDGAR